MCLLEGDISFYKIKDQLNNRAEQYFKDYLSFLTHRKSSNTVAIAKGVFNKFSNFLSDLNITELRDITTLVLNQYIDNMDAAPKTKKNHIGVLSLMFKQAQINGFLKNNPAKHVTLPKIVKTERHRLLDNEDLKIIFKYSDKWYLYYKFLLFTGLRAGDVAMLRYEDIDLLKGSITTLIRKSDRTHQIPLSNTLIDDIKDKVVLNSPIFPSLYTENNRKRNDNLSKPRLHMQKALKRHKKSKATLQTHLE
jgi:integrase